LALNGSVSFVESLPYSVSRSISITATEMILLYLILVFVCIFLFLKKPKMLIISLVFFLIFMGSLSSHLFRTAHQKKIIVYNIVKHTAIDFINGNECYFVTDSLLACDSRKQDFHIVNSRIQNNAHVISTLLYNDSTVQSNNIFYKNHGLIYFAGKSIAIVDKINAHTTQIKVDFLLMVTNPKIGMDAILKQYKPGLVIIDASNYPRKIMEWVKQCKLLHIPYYVTPVTGAMVYEF